MACREVSAALQRLVPVARESERQQVPRERSVTMLAPVTVIASPARDSEIALELRSGHVVRLRGVVDEDQLARAIRASERSGC